jgi:hypothetical protein
MKEKKLSLDFRAIDLVVEMVEPIDFLVEASIQL